MIRPAGGGSSPGRGTGGPGTPSVAGPGPAAGWWVTALVEAGAPARRPRGLIVAGGRMWRARRRARLGRRPRAGPFWPIRVPGLDGPRPGVIGGRRRHPAVGAASPPPHRPEVILRLGDRWVSKVVNGFLPPRSTGGAPPAWRSTRSGRWPDPGRQVADLRPRRPLPPSAARWSVASDGPDPGRPGRCPPGRWHEEWRRAEARAQGAIDDLLGTDRGAARGAAVASPRWPAGWWPPCPARPPWWSRRRCPSATWRPSPRPGRDPPRVLANRGANGIDGVVSTALGVALATPARRWPWSAIWPSSMTCRPWSAPPGSTPDLTVVVADNRGGGIFSFLDPAATRLEDRGVRRALRHPAGPRRGRGGGRVRMARRWISGTPPAQPRSRRRCSVGWRPRGRSVIRVRPSRAPGERGPPPGGQRRHRRPPWTGRSGGLSRVAGS